MNQEVRPKPPGLLPVDKARARILSGLAPIEPETVPLERAAGRISSEDVRALISHPPFAVQSRSGVASQSTSALRQIFQMLSPMPSIAPAVLTS